MNRTKSAVVLVFDRLGASFLGPYGNTWLETPGWNQWASESLIWEQCWSDSTELSSIYRSWWFGTHAASGPALPPWSSLIERLNRADVHTLLLTDEPAVAQHPGAAAFEELIELPAITSVKPCQNPEDCAIPQFMARLTTIQEQLPENALVWAHCRGMSGPWDAPLDMRDAFRDDEDPPAYEGVEPPALVLPAGYDPDQTFPWLQAYSAQVRLLDMTLACYLDDLKSLGPAATVITAARGYPLGEHLRVGLPVADHAAGQLFQELLHVPLLWRSPEGTRAGWRRQDLVQHPDLPASLLAWFDLAPERSCWGRNLLADGSAEVALAVVGDPPYRETALRTPAWLLRQSNEPDAQQCELYVKPDDRFEINDVARRCPEVVEQLQAAAQSFLQHAIAHRRPDLPTLARELVEFL